MLAFRHASDYCVRRRSDMPVFKLFGLIPIGTVEPAAPEGGAPVVPVDAQPETTEEEDPQKVSARAMAEDSKWAAAQLAEASVELSNERRLLEAHRRRREAQQLREQRDYLSVTPTGVQARDRRDDRRREARPEDPDFQAGYQAGLQGHAQAPGNRTGGPHRRYTAGWNRGDRERRQQDGGDQEQGPVGGPAADL